MVFKIVVGVVARAFAREDEVYQHHSSVRVVAGVKNSLLFPF
jgi:hypothetical protein